MRELVLSGKVRRVEVGEYTGKNGEKVPTGKIVLSNEWDKYEIEQGMRPSRAVMVKIDALQGREGKVVDLLVGVMSGDDFRADARFVFLDDLTPAGVKA